MLANSVSCSLDLLQTAIVLACAEEKLKTLSNGWSYSRDSVEELCLLAQHAFVSGDDDVSSEYQGLAHAVQACLEPSTSPFSGNTVLLLKSMMRKSADNFGISPSADAVRQLQVST